MLSQHTIITSTISIFQKLSELGTSSKQIKAPTISWLGDGVGVRIKEDLPPLTFRLSNLKHNFNLLGSFALGTMSYVLPTADAFKGFCYSREDRSFCNFMINNNTDTMFAYLGRGKYGQLVFDYLVKGGCKQITYLEERDVQYLDWCVRYKINNSTIWMEPLLRYTENPPYDLLFTCDDLKKMEGLKCIDEYIKSLRPEEFPWLMTAGIAGASLCTLGSLAFFGYTLYQKKYHNIPIEFLCPITKKIMKDPVLINDGYTYEREAIEAYRIAGKKCPQDQSQNITILIPNNNLKAQIIEFHESKITKKTKNSDLSEEDKHYICPITLDLMEDPVTTDDGNTYERKDIEEQQQRGGKCPLNRDLPITNIIPNKILALQIHHYQEKMSSSKGYKPVSVV